MKYREKEMLDSIEISNNFENILDKIKEKKLRKVVLTKDNEPEAVILPIKKYRKFMKAMDNLEHLEIYLQIKDRMNDPIENGISFDEMLKRLNINKNEL